MSIDDQVNQVISGQRVLIVEDEPAMAKALEVKLNKSGFSALSVIDPKVGIEELKKGGYGLVLLDIMMPGMNGWEFLGLVKELNINVKIIITSNLSQEEDKKKAVELGAVNFMVKSDSSLSDIVEMVKSILLGG